MINITAILLSIKVELSLSFQMKLQSYSVFFRVSKEYFKLEKKSIIFVCEINVCNNTNNFILIIV